MMKKEKKQTTPLCVHIDSDVCAAFREYAEKHGQSYTKCAEIIFKTYLSERKEREASL